MTYKMAICDDCDADTEYLSTAAPCPETSSHAATNEERYSVSASQSSQIAIL